MVGQSYDLGEGDGPCKLVASGAVQNRCSRNPGRSHKSTNHIFRLTSPVYDMHMHIFKVNVFIKQAKYE